MLAPKAMKTTSPNDLGKKFIVEECRKLSLKDYMARARSTLKKAILESELSVFDRPIKLVTSLTRFGGTRYWFECPNCERRVGILFFEPLTNKVGCRVCLGLKYRKQRYKGMPENTVC